MVRASPRWRAPTTSSAGDALLLVLLRGDRPVVTVAHTVRAPDAGPGPQQLALDGPLGHPERGRDPAAAVLQERPREDGTLAHRQRDDERQRLTRVA
jgi:hypothetical protein